MTKFIFIAALLLSSCGQECEQGYVLADDQCMAAVEYRVICEDGFTDVECWSADQVSEVVISEHDRRYSCLWESAVYKHHWRDVYVIVYFRAVDGGCYQVTDEVMKCRKCGE